MTRDARPWVLHVDDNPGDLELTELAFQEAKLDIRYQGVLDPSQALAILAQPRPAAACETAALQGSQLVILDVNMPCISGIQLLDRMRSSPPCAQRRVVMLTSSQREEDLQRCLELGATGCYVKPARFEDLVELVKRLLQDDAESPPAPAPPSAPSAPELIRSAPSARR